MWTVPDAGQERYPGPVRSHRLLGTDSRDVEDIDPHGKIRRQQAGNRQGMKPGRRNRIRGRHRRVYPPPVPSVQGGGNRLQCCLVDAGGLPAVNRDHGPVVAQE